MKRILLICAVLVTALAEAQDRIVQPLGNASNSVEVRGAFRLNDTVANAALGSIAYKTGVVYAKTPAGWTALGGGGASFSGTTLQYVRGDGSYATFPTLLSQFTDDMGYLSSATGYTKTQINAFFGGTAVMGGYNKTAWDLKAAEPNHAGLYPTITRFTDSLAAHWTAIMAGIGGGSGIGDMVKATYDTDNDGVVDNAELLAGQNAAYFLARANHTGTQAISTVTGLQAALDAKQALDADLTTIAGLSATTNNFLTSVAGAWASRTPTQVKVTLGLDNVENVPLSTWSGTSNIVTVGTLASGAVPSTLVTGTKTSTYISNFTTRVQAITDSIAFNLRNAGNTSFDSLLRQVGANEALIKRISVTGSGVTRTVTDSTILYQIAGSGGTDILPLSNSFTGTNNSFSGKSRFGSTGTALEAADVRGKLYLGNGGDHYLDANAVETNYANSGTTDLTWETNSIPRMRIDGVTGTTHFLADASIETVTNDDTKTRVLVLDELDGNRIKWREASTLGSGDGGSGTINSGTQYRLPYYASTGTTLSQAAAITGGRALISDANGVPTHSTATATNLNYIANTTSDVQTQLNGKQATLTSGTTIKTINGTSLLGSGDITISGGGTVDATLTDGSTNAIQNNAVFDGLALKANTTDLLPLVLTSPAAGDELVLGSGGTSIVNQTPSSTPSVSFTEFLTTATGGQTTYTHAAISGKHIEVYRDGRKQRPTDHFTVAGSTVTFNLALSEGEEIQIVASTLAAWTTVVTGGGTGSLSPGSLLINTSEVYTAPTGGEFGWTSGLSPYSLASGNDGRIYAKRHASDGERFMLGFDATNSNVSYTSFDAMVLVDGGGVMFTKTAAGSFTATGVTLAVGEYVGLFRTGSDIKLQKSSDAVTWSDVATISGTFSGTLYALAAVYNDNITPGKLYYPTREGLQ